MGHSQLLEIHQTVQWHWVQHNLVIFLDSSRRSTNRFLFDFSHLLFLAESESQSFTPRNFAKGEEKYLHILIWLLALAFPTVVVALKDFNPTIFGSVCVIISYPYGCGRGEEYGEDYLECT